jgi:uncharacterized C2H2 Zn-finger protein
MNNYKCNNCNNIFVSKQSLEKHINKKIKCDIVTDYKCNKCNKYFKQKKNLLQHQEKDFCLSIIDKNNSVPSMATDIKNILNSECTIDEKADLIITINDNLDMTRIKNIININIPFETKINLLVNAKKTVTTINNTNSNNNITNNNHILINNFGNENVDYITNKAITKLINSNYSEELLLKISDEIYLNEKHPENQTIKIDNLNNKFCKVKEKNKWITTTKDAALKKIFDRVFEIVINCIDDTKDVISEEKINIINGYIEKDFEDEIIVEAVKKLALNIYNFYNSSVI